MHLPNPPSHPDRDGNRLKRAAIKKLWAEPLVLAQAARARGEHLRAYRLEEKAAQIQKQIRELCARDFHFWHNHFCWAYDEHKHGEDREFPLVEYDFQRDFCAGIIANIWRAALEENYRWNGAADKCRKMCVTASLLDIILWFAMFHGISTAITSKTDDDVDRPEDLDTPFERIRWQLKRQPAFLLPEKFNINSKQQNKTGLLNFQNGGRIVGCAPSGEAVRQGRCLIWFGDEFGFVKRDAELWDGVSGTVKVRFVASTPNGPHCKYYRVIANEDGDNAQIFELDWWLHPDYAEGLYLKDDGSLSSPWFDSILASSSRQTVAREYLRDHNDAVGGRIFGMFRGESIVPQLIRVTKDELYCALDPGLCFAGVWGHKDNNRALRIYRELVIGDDEAQAVNKAVIDKMAEEILKINKTEFKGYEVYYIGDPNSSRRKGPQERETDYELMSRKYKIRVLSKFLYAIPSDERREKRIKLLQDLMTTWVETENGLRPLLLIDKDGAPRLIEAFRGKYRRKILDDGTVTEEVVKIHPYNDVVDCAGYLAIYLDDEQSKARGGKPKIAKRKTAWRRSGRGYQGGRTSRFSAG